MFSPSSYGQTGTGKTYTMEVRLITDLDRFGMQFFHSHSADELGQGESPIILHSKVQDGDNDQHMISNKMLSIPRCH